MWADRIAQHIQSCISHKHISVCYIFNWFPKRSTKEIHILNQQEPFLEHREPTKSWCVK